MMVRITTAIILSLGTVSAVLWAPDGVFKSIILLIVAGGLYEFFRLVLSPVPLYHVAGWIWGLALSSAILLEKFQGALAILLLGLFLISLIHMRHATVPEGVTVRISLTVMGVVYIGATIPFWGLLHTLPHGRALIFLGIAAAAMSDTFALFIGKALGRHKFAPMTSPNKTMEGFIAGFAGSIFGAYIIKMVAWPELPLPHVFILGLLIGILGPMGDLIESLFKRDYHVKDSGNVIPGHGGFLDRLDAMIFTGPFVYFYAKFFLLG